MASSLRELVERHISRLPLPEYQSKEDKELNALLDLLLLMEEALTKIVDQQVASYEQECENGDRCDCSEHVARKALAERDRVIQEKTNVDR